MRPECKVLGAALTPLTSSQDLNDLKTVGDYYAGGTVASTLQHCPVTGAFTLNVRSTTDNLQTSSRVIQTIVVNAVLPSIYRRTFTASGWSSWYLNYDESMLSQPTLLSPLASALGVKRGNFGNTSTSQVVTTKANSNGLLIIGDLSTGGYGFYVIANMVPRLISQMYNDDNIKFSVEKDGNSLVITRTSTSSPGYDNLHYAYLEAY